MHVFIDTCVIIRSIYYLHLPGILSHFLLLDVDDIICVHYNIASIEPTKPSTLAEGRANKA